VSAAELADAALIVRRVEEAGCTFWFSVPSLLIFLMTMKALHAGSLPSIRRIAFGGEGYPKRELLRLMARFGERARLINVYGPTECTCICSAYPISVEDLADGVGLPPLGQIAENCGHLILDDAREVAEGEAGELCLYGPQLALGYYNDPERTAVAFTPNPRLKGVPGVIYRTGDLVRQAGGMLHFIGRKDNQIKHMGYRIELEEVEAAAQLLPGIIQAAVVYRRVREGHGLIVAHLALPPDAPRDEAALRAALRATLPDYMLPNRFVFWEDLPKNANGKVDRVALRDG
jgi:D-alanine--poly(phosphoribitol) ligase subunit 1